jgi:hypothetical protein
MMAKDLPIGPAEAQGQLVAASMRISRGKGH